MYLQHFGLKHDPLVNTATSHVSNPQFVALQEHMKHLLQTKGIGMLTGYAGVGKTTALRQIIKALNPHQYHTIYQAENHFQPFDIYCQLADAFGLEKRHRYSLLWRDIKKHILHLADDKKITPIWILDEAHQLSTRFLHQLPSFLNFDFDSCQPMIILFVGLPNLAETLSKTAYASLASRVKFHYQWKPLDDDKTFADFIHKAFEIAGAKSTLLSDTAIHLIHMASKGRLRYAHRIISCSLQIAADKKFQHLPDDIIEQSIETLKTIS